MMAVVINEFELVAEPQPQPQTGNNNNSQSPPAQPTPRDIERIVRRKLERMLRIWAH